MSPRGRHVLADLWGCKPLEAEAIAGAAKQAAVLAGATVREVVCHEFTPEGCSVIVVLAESHLSVHTYPECGYVAVDVFTCGSTARPTRAVRFLRDCFKASACQVRHVPRGLEPKLVA